MKFICPITSPARGCELTPLPLGSELRAPPAGPHLPPTPGRRGGPSLQAGARGPCRAGVPGRVCTWPLRAISVVSLSIQGDVFIR